MCWQKSKVKDSKWKSKVGNITLFVWKTEIYFKLDLIYEWGRGRLDIYKSG